MRESVHRIYRLIIQNTVIYIYIVVRSRAAFTDIQTVGRLNRSYQQRPTDTRLSCRPVRIAEMLLFHFSEC